MRPKREDRKKKMTAGEAAVKISKSIPKSDYETMWKGLKEALVKSRDMNLRLARSQLSSGNHAAVAISQSVSRTLDVLLLHAGDLEREHSPWHHMTFEYTHPEGGRIWTETKADLPKEMAKL